jgi:hypothetical protein
MTHIAEPIRPNARLLLVAAALFSLGALCAPSALAQQVPSRFYWKTLSGASALPLIVNSTSGNTNPFDPALIVSPGSKIGATVALAGYGRTFSLFNRSALAAILVPMGRISGDVIVAGKTISQSTNGFGNPVFELDTNVLGPPAQKNLPDVLRYTPGFSVDVLADLAFPIGQYDSTQPLNIGQHRWYGRVAAPIVLQLGPWVPGQRTTLEFLPAVWLFGPNNNYLGQTLKNDPLFQLDAHLTRDFTENVWGSFDIVWYYGDEPNINGVAGKKLNNFGAGPTLGYKINDDLNLTLSYKSTFTGSASTDLRMDSFMASLVYGWHPLIEGARRLKSGN